MKLLLLAIMLSMFLGCIPSHGKRFSTLVPDMYVSEIERLNDLIVSGSEQAANIADAHLQLALLYSSYNNPKRDYSRALKEIEKYVALEPKSDQDYEIQNLLSMLKSIRNDTHERRDLKLVSENKELKQKTEELSEDIEKLNETIDKLKQLDVELEKKRKSFK